MRSGVRLGVNIDHIATVRNARGVDYPDPVRIAQMAVDAGADGITAHLREDRRHIRDRDVRLLKDELVVPLNLELAATAEMVEIATRVRPHAACIVPEKRNERTTEGGLDVVGQFAHLRDATRELADAAIRVSLFVEPSRSAIEAAGAMGAPVVELHTGSWCNALLLGDEIRAAEEFARLRAAARYAADNGIECHAGHGLDYGTARIIAGLPEIAELNIGHFLIGEAIAVGIAETVRVMREAITQGVAARNAPEP